MNNTATNPRPTTFEEVTKTPTVTIITNNKQSTSQCTAIATTAGVISAIITALLVGGICLIIDMAVYQCFYKPRLRSFLSTAVGVLNESHNSRYCQREDVTGSGEAIVYDIDDERPRVGAALEMEENEAYSVNKRVEGPEIKQNEAYCVINMRVVGSEMEQNEAYGVNKRMEGPEMEQNEAYGISKREGGPEMEENEAYSVINKRVEGPEIMENEAYGVRVEGPEMEGNEAYGVTRST
jgi:hypothetical protein